MPVCRRMALPVAALAAVALGAPVAGAQTIPAPEELPPVSQQPQIEEPEPAPEEPAPAREEPAPAPQASALPNTGSDARVVALLGATVLLTGVGLRLRTAPERF